MKEKSLEINCPHCGHQFSPEKAIESHLRTHLEKEFADKMVTNSKLIEEKAKEVTKAQFATKLEALENETLMKTQKIKELENESVTLAQRERELKEREENLGLEMKKQLLVIEKEIRSDAERKAQAKAEVEFLEKEARLMQQQESLETTIKKAALEQVEKVRSEERLKQAELQMKLDSQTRMAEEMKRKAEQGSMQLQGEVQELAIEEYLVNVFPKDEVEEISKGVRGGDCVHVVKDNFGNECGRILYESKRTKAFSKEWIVKLKDDMRLKQAEIGVIITEAMPGELTRFGQIDGIWICTFSEFKSVALLMRHTINRIGEVIAAQDNKGDKMKLLYDATTDGNS